MRKIFPREYEARAGDKLHYRYPGVGGESYLDLIMRLQEVRPASPRPRASWADGDCGRPHAWLPSSQV